jgi:hypothetical protein
MCTTYIVERHQLLEETLAKEHNTRHTQHYKKKNYSEDNLLEKKNPKERKCFFFL